MVYRLQQILVYSEKPWFQMVPTLVRTQMESSTVNEARCQRAEHRRAQRLHVSGSTCEDSLQSGCSLTDICLASSSDKCNHILSGQQTCLNSLLLTQSSASSQPSPAPSPFTMHSSTLASEKPKERRTRYATNSLKRLLSSGALVDTCSSGLTSPA